MSDLSNSDILRRIDAFLNRDHSEASLTIERTPDVGYTVAGGARERATGGSLIQALDAFLKVVESSAQPSSGRSSFATREDFQKLSERISSLERSHLPSEDVVRVAVDRSLAGVRQEYTALPRFAYHLPLDYEHKTLPPKFDAPVWVDGETLPIPPVSERHGLVADEKVYLDWGRYDHDVILSHIQKAMPSRRDLSILDFGCSSGRILRHFYKEKKELGWRLTGVDVSAKHIEWLRRFFPRDFEIYVGSILPSMPFATASFDVIYGHSVFTHLKFLWDMWLLELRRTLRPDGILIQTIHTEHAWSFFYNESQKEGWKAENFGGLHIDTPEMPADFVYFGNIDNNNIFWKKDVAHAYWSRYFSDVQIIPSPEKFNYQSWVIARK
jgi:SAM-dependent methyltransferase